jgi:hypothetical protein
MYFGRAGAARSRPFDELRLGIGPMIVGRGRRLLDGLPSIQLELVRSEISPTSDLLGDYRVIR